MNDRQLALRHLFCALRESPRCESLIDLVLDENTNTICCIYSNGYKKNIVLSSTTIEEMIRKGANVVEEHFRREKNEDLHCRKNRRD